jgi:hypothetical protein
MKKLQKRTNVSIAEEEGCSEAAVRNSLVKIQKKFLENPIIGGSISGFFSG